MLRNLLVAAIALFATNGVVFAQHGGHGGGGARGGGFHGGGYEGYGGGYGGYGRGYGGYGGYGRGYGGYGWGGWGPGWGWGLGGWGYPYYGGYGLGDYFYPYYGGYSLGDYSYPYYGGYAYSYPTSGSATYDSNSFPIANVPLAPAAGTTTSTSSYTPSDNTSGSFFSGQKSTGTATGSAATVRVIAPPGAQVWFNNTTTPPKSGATWEFHSANLNPGSVYQLNIKARLSDNQDYTMRLPVMAGDDMSVNLMYLQ